MRVLFAKSTTFNDILTHFILFLKKLNRFFFNFNPFRYCSKSMDSNKADSEASEMNGSVEVMVESPKEVANGGKSQDTSTNKIDKIEAKDTSADKMMSKSEAKSVKTEKSPTREVTINAEEPSTSSSNAKALSYSQELAARRKQFMSQPSTVATRRQQAVCVRRAHKSYGPKNNPNVILDGLNMTVPKGSMYVIPHSFVFSCCFFYLMRYFHSNVPVAFVCGSVSHSHFCFEFMLICGFFFICCTRA